MQPNHLEGTLMPHERPQTVVPVLVDEQHPEIGMCLAVQRAQQPFRFVDSVDGGDDEVERG